MRNTITLNGIKSSDIAGLLIQSLPPITKPLMRTEIEEIDGRDGDIVTNLGFSAYDKEIIIGLYGDFDINQVIAYFNSEGVVVFSNEPDKYYNYQIINQIDFDRLLRYRTATVTMHCQPFKYSTTENPITLGSNPPTTVSGEGNEIVLQNTSEAPFDQLDLKGDTTQQTYTGKNLFNINADQRPNARCTATINGEAITITSTVDSTGFYCVLIPNSDDLLGKTATLSIESVTTNTNGRIYVNQAVDTSLTTVSNTVGSVQTISSGSSVTKELTFPDSFASGKNCFVITFYVSDQGASTVVDDYSTYSNIQLEIGSTATSFEPYVGGIASPNPNYPQDINVVTDRQTVKINGKNLCSASSYGSNNVYMDFDPAQLDQTFTVSFISDVTTAYSAIIYLYTDGSNRGTIGVNLPQTANKRTSATVTLSNELYEYVTNATTARLAAYRSGSNHNTSLTPEKAMIENGSTLTEYKPYQEQTYKLDLLPVLYDATTNTSGKYLTDTGSQSSSVAWYITDYIPVTVGNKYKYSGITNAGTAPYSCYYDSNKAFVSSFKQAVGENILTIPSDVAYVRFSIYNADVNNFVFGDIANAIELCKIGDYQDYFYKDDGDWYLHKDLGKIVLNGTGNYNTLGDGTNGIKRFKFTDGSIGNVDKTLRSTYSDIYQGIRMEISTSTPNSIAQFTSQNMLAITTDSTTLTLNEFKTALSSNPATVYYALDTPTNTQIIDTDLIQQLEAVSNAHSWNPITYITATSDGTNLPFTITATAVGNMDGTITNSGNISARPKLTIYGSGDISIFLNGVQLFQIALGTEGYITIDTNAMEAYKDTTDNLKNRLVIGDYSNFVLKPGANQIGFSGNTTMCVVENYSRWL